VDHFSGLNDVKMWQLFLEVYDMDDDYLMEEVLNLEYLRYNDIEEIVNRYMLKGSISKEDREKLIGFYILVWHDEDWED
jgi:hypothetical protein